MSDSANQMCALKQLPHDLIESILPLLPPKSLGRFKSVSKGWNSLISSPNFIKTHILNYNRKNPNLNPTHLILVSEDCESLYSLELTQLNTLTTVTAKSLNFQQPLVRILGSCNGLLLCYDYDENLFLVNPITRMTFEVPESGREGNLYGFGYDSSTDDYKVISISNIVSDLRSICVGVYSLRNNLWDMSVPNLPYYVHCSYRSRVPLLNNNLHWLVSTREWKDTIVVFSLVDEEFHEMGLPDLTNYVRWEFSEFRVLDGKLVFVLCAKSINELWVMEEYGVPESWTKRCILEDDMWMEIDFFAQVSNQDILLATKRTDEISISKYDMDEKIFTSITVEGCQEDFVVYDTYVETLESLERFR